MRNNVLLNCRLFALSMIVKPGLIYSPALNMDSQSGVFVLPWADVLPAASNTFNVAILGVHIVDTPSDLIHAARIVRLPDSPWRIDIGTGHVGANLAPGNVKANNALGLGIDYRFESQFE